MKIFDKVKSSIKSVKDGAAKGSMKAKSAISGAINKQVKNIDKLNPFNKSDKK